MSKQNLINNLTNSGLITRRSIKKAFERVDRKDFVLREYKDLAYADQSLPIGFDQTISQPSTVAFMLKLLNVKEGDLVLDVGSGSGWTSALLAQIVSGSGFVTAVERIEDLINRSILNTKKYRFENIAFKKAGKELGYSENAPYDKILVSATSDDIPEELIDQLKLEGVMVVPVKNSILRVKKTKSGAIRKRDFPGFVFVKLIKDEDDED
ncbi:MAG: Protein-L-isoaspartate O-methyltransferase [candidate division WS2 bacterium ADurb.Bin280]|uniref:Protein-L-isoaspartate O-methyltransferase n=1 Tax=candidate division WS2 bacterium ADurb.Bin280 TaxID=1852829 RepID=A0A1V5SFU7_9BACT|nr:MAG: Protein-L-isoaspartate O-methyltransferase [candidate division WS2 bacterium ADurb.Bin280]